MNGWLEGVPHLPEKRNRGSKIAWQELLLMSRFTGAPLLSVERGLGRQHLGVTKLVFISYAFYVFANLKTQFIFSSPPPPRLLHPNYWAPSILRAYPVKRRTQPAAS